MRKYRAKTISPEPWEEKWVHGFYTCFNDKEHRIYGGYAETDCGYYYPDWWKVDPETVGQCTGIFGDFIKGEPKAGDNIKRSFIYEGDIVKPVLIDGTHIGFSWGRQVVVFDRGAFCLKDRRGQLTPMCNYAANVQFRVLGNIHDNPELLEVSE